MKDSHAKIDPAKLDAIPGKALGDLSTGYAGAKAALCAKLGPYRAMAGTGPLTPAEVAARAGCAERYVREWLGSQVASGNVLRHPGRSS